MNDPSTVRFVLTNPLHSCIDLILEQYQIERSREQRFGSVHPLWGSFRALARFLESSDPVQRRQPHLDVSWSLGQGNWASVPWVACLDRRDTSTTQRSVYVDYLFREDMTGVYLVLNQGVTSYTQEFGRVEGRSQLQARAEQLRSDRAISSLSRVGFSLDNSIELHTNSERARNYAYGSIAHRLYLRGAVPFDEQLEVDLERMLQAYDAYLSKTMAASSAPASIATQKPTVPEIPGLASSQPSVTHRLFVSHAHQDSAYCRQFVDGLKASGLDVWYDEQGIEAGAAWLATVQRELESRELFLLIVTPESWASEWVQQELQLALIRRRRIIPLMYKQTEVSGLILTRQWIDAVGLGPQQAAARVSASLRTNAPA